MDPYAVVVDPNEVDARKETIAELHKELNRIRGKKTRVEFRCCPEYQRMVEKLYREDKALNDLRIKMKSFMSQSTSIAES